MPLTKKERKHHKDGEIQKETRAKDILREIFGANNNPTLPKIVQAGLIDSNMTYELARGKVPSTERDYFTVRITTHRRDTNLEDLLMSGVFLTRHDAQSYIDYMKSKSGPPLGA